MPSPFSAARTGLRVASVGGGPAGLYFGILWKQVDPTARITIYERNQPDDTFGFGVVFSDATLDNLAQADPATYAEIRRHFAHWDDIDIHIGGRVFRSTGHGFCGLERKTLLNILQARCKELGVEVHYQSPVDDVEALRREHDVVLGADGVTSLVRQRYAATFEPEIVERPNRFVWLGTSFPFPAFTFYFKPSEHGLFRVHAYRYRDEGSTFIVECGAETWARAGFREDDEDGTIGYLERLFADELAGHPLIKNRSIWRRFPVITNRRWSHENVVLMGDAVHTAHFSIGSGTKLAMEDAIALRDALVAEAEVPHALTRYEATRRPPVEALQRSAQISLEWFEHTERYMAMAPVQFCYSLMTRSLRVNHGSLQKRDGELVREVEAWFAARHGVDPRRPRAVPLELGGVRVASRLVGEVAAAELGAAIAGLAGLGLGALVVRGASELAGDEARRVATAALAAGLPPIAPIGDAAAGRRARDAGFALLAVEEGPAQLATLGELAASGAPLIAQLAQAGRSADEVAALAEPIVRAGAKVLWLTDAPTGRLAAMPLSDRLRNDLGVATLIEGVAAPDDQDSALAAGRADLLLV